MIVPAAISQDKLARDQYTNTFTLDNIVFSTIDALVPIPQVLVARCECGGFRSLFPFPNNVSFRDSTSEPSLPVTIGSILGGVAFLLLLVALAYFLWRVRQGRVHVERIGLDDIIPRMSFSPESPPLLDAENANRSTIHATSISYVIFQSYQDTDATHSLQRDL